MTFLLGILKHNVDLRRRNVTTFPLPITNVSKIYLKTSISSIQCFSSCSISDLLVAPLKKLISIIVSNILFFMWVGGANLLFSLKSKQFKDGTWMLKFLGYQFWHRLSQSGWSLPDMPSPGKVPNDWCGHFCNVDRYLWCDDNHEEAEHEEEHNDLERGDGASHPLQATHFHQLSPPHKT